LGIAAIESSSSSSLPLPVPPPLPSHHQQQQQQQSSNLSLSSRGSVIGIGGSIGSHTGSHKRGLIVAERPSAEEYQKMKEDLSLKEADNHFLSEELEQKDRMLSMLTEGLKEVRGVIMTVTER
jgi:ABC-type histidine transport system ATPase subunit